jgi:uncharacterized protein (DUF1800 family)
MRFDPELAEIRFGCGLSPQVAPPASPQQMLARLRAPDTMATRFPIEDFPTFEARIVQTQRQRQLRRQNRGTPQAQAAQKAGRVLNQQARIAHIAWLGQHLNRWVATDAPLRERLSFFWADHFTTAGKAGIMRRAVSPYMQTAIRPHLTGRFEDMLIAAVLHPVMIQYLDQDRSVGPNSEQAARGGKLTGLNENPAREVIELHTLGADGPYTQTDVSELAELLTGVTVAKPMRLNFRKNMSEPGQETVLGQTYGGETAHIHDVKAVLRDLARHPATARHLARKLATHFTADTPDPDLLGALEARYLDTGGDLGAVTEALLTHPSAWNPVRQNVKPAFHFIASALRALAVEPAAINALQERAAQRTLIQPMAQMGHLWQKPSGPDGLPEEDTAWLTPQGIATRLQWAITVPQILMGDLPDPRQFVRAALGDTIPPAVTFAAEAAETRADGVGLILASPAFQRT